MSRYRIEDVRELLGMQTIAARVIIIAFVATFALLAWVTAPPDAFWQELIAWVAVSGAAICLIAVPGDPLPLPVTVALTVSGPLATTLVLSVVPVPITSFLELWPLSAATAVYTYMCVRGRTWWAWAGMIASLACCLLWAHRTGQGALYGLSVSAVNLAPLLMATFFAATIRPAARDIFRLRRETTARVADEAAERAMLQERDSRLDELDELVRPLLERLSVDAPIPDGDRLEAGLLEAHLRDTLRAPALATPSITTATAEVRARGVEVVMLDDQGLDGVDDDVRERLEQSVLESLNAAESGTLTIRLLPPGRAALLTVVHNTGGEVSRLEFGHDGRLARQR